MANSTEQHGAFEAPGAMRGSFRIGRGFFRLAIIGNLGLPADLPKAGGGERGAESIATRLAQRGHHVTMYCRWHYNRHPPSPWKGVYLNSLPSINTKNLDTPSHTLLASLHVVLKNTADVVVYHGMGNALFAPLLKLGSKKTVVYLDGVDWERPKWGKLARFALKTAAWIAFRMADVVCVDNHASQRVFAECFGKAPLLITLGAELWDPPGSDLLTIFGLESERYILFVGLLKPDKGVHFLIEAYRSVDTAMPLVIVGDCPEEPEYVRSLKNMADDRVIFPGYVYGHAARQLFANCYVYVQPSIMEGNSPALMSAMSCGRCTVVSGIEQNLETIGKAGLSFVPGDVSGLLRILDMLIRDPDRVRALGCEARRRVEQVYDWDVVVDQFEEVYMSLVGM